MRELLERIPNPQQYYRLTGSSFRALCPERSGHMNMGLWPAPSLRVAQEQLIFVALGAARDLFHRWELAPRGVMDLGSGWGGTAPLWSAAFPGIPYVGINASAEQVKVARAAAASRSGQAGPEHVRYISARAEDGDLPWQTVDLVLSIEAMFHFVDKSRIIQAMTRSVRGAVLLEICVEDPRVLDDPLLLPSLHAAWSTARYERAFADHRWSRVHFEDVGARVFEGFSACLRTIDESSFEGRRAILRQLIRATEALARAHERGGLRYVLVVADR